MKEDGETERGRAFRRNPECLQIIGPRRREGERDGGKEDGELGWNGGMTMLALFLHDAQPLPITSNCGASATILEKEKIPSLCSALFPIL